MERWSTLITRDNGAIVAKIKTSLPDGEPTVAIEECDFILECFVSDKNWDEASKRCTLPTGHLIDYTQAIFSLSYPDY